MGRPWRLRRCLGERGPCLARAFAGALVAFQRSRPNEGDAVSASSWAPPTEGRDTRGALRGPVCLMVNGRYRNATTLTPCQCLRHSARTAFHSTVTSPGNKGSRSRRQPLFVHRLIDGAFASAASWTTSRYGGAPGAEDLSSRVLGSPCCPRLAVRLSPPIGWCRVRLRSDDGGSTRRSTGAAQ